MHKKWDFYVNDTNVTTGPSGLRAQPGFHYGLEITCDIMAFSFDWAGTNV